MNGIEAKVKGSDNEGCLTGRLARDCLRLGALEPRHAPGEDVRGSDSILECGYCSCTLHCEGMLLLLDGTLPPEISRRLELSPPRFCKAPEIAPNGIDVLV